ncbi:MAG: cell division protein SepF [Bowdeniella nasicola]|nr:cell division protein SepF [Bowdeniella nasicola]
MAGVFRKTMSLFALDPQEEDYRDDRAYDEGIDEEYPEEESYSAEVTPLHADQGASVASIDQDMYRIVTFHPRAYEEARSIGSAFREGIPVILNLTDVPEADAKRILDFCSGLVYGLDGGIEKVTQRVFLLSPATVEVYRDEQDSRPLHQIG